MQAQILYRKISASLIYELATRTSPAVIDWWPIKKRLAPSSAPVSIVLYGQCMKCGLCNQVWPILQSSSGIVPETGRAQIGGLPLSPAPPIAASTLGHTLPSVGQTPRSKLFASLEARPAIDFNKVTLKGVAESEQRIDLLSVETRTVQNDTTDTPQKRRAKFSQTFERIPMISTDRTTVRGGEGGLSIAGIGALTGRAQLTVSHHYSVSQRESFTVEDEVEVTVPPGRTIEVEFEWMLVRKEGVVTFQEQPGAGSPFWMPLTFEIPYCMPMRVVAGRSWTHEIEPSARGEETGKAPAPKGRADSARDDLAALSKSELYERAKELEIAHRSAMTRDQLQSAVARALRRKNH